MLGCEAIKVARPEKLRIRPGVSGLIFYYNPGPWSKSDRLRFQEVAVG